mgnify:CR=1 FL=1
MRKVILAGLALALACKGFAWANSAPVVSDVTASQRTDGSGIVDIRYTLMDDDNDRCTISVQVSDDGGSTWTVPAMTFLASSAVGPNIAPGQRQIQWDSKADLPGAFGTNYRIKITAHDGATGPDMVRIPGGTFQMGDSFSEGDSDERPVHTVTLSSFSMSRCEITNGQYCEFLNSAQSQGLIAIGGGRVYQAGSGTSYPYCETLTSSAYSQIAYSGGAFSVRTKAGRAMYDDPMVDVSWYGAAAYCAWAGGRLPTEAEWEYAARGPQAWIYPWGTAFNGSYANYCDASCPQEWRDTAFDDGFAQWAPVGSYAGGASWCGAMDMAGNVWEWVNDWWSEDYYAHSPTENPQGPDSGTIRIARGGSWYDESWRVSASCRKGLTPSSYRMHWVGFRCVVPVEP